MYWLMGLFFQQKHPPVWELAGRLLVLVAEVIVSIDGHPLLDASRQIAFWMQER